MDLSGQQGNRELVNNMQKWGSADLASWVNLRISEFRVKLSCREAHQKRFFHQNGSRVAVGEEAGEGVLQEGSMGGHRNKVSENHSSNTRPPDDLNRSSQQGFQAIRFAIYLVKVKCEVNERFVISEDYSSLPINVGAPSFAISNNCKQLTVINTIVLLTSG